MLKKIFLTLCLLSVAMVSFAQEFKVSDVRVEGNSRVETSTILAAVPIKPGDEVTPEEVDAALSDIFSLGRFDDVNAELTDVQGAKVLTFVVSEMPLIRKIRFEGNDELDEKKLRPLVKFRTPEILNHVKVKQSVEEIKKAYVEEGYHAAKITPEIKTDEKNEAVLTFKIDEGKQVLIDKIRFVGNTAIDDDDLKDAMETQESWWLSWLTDRGAYRKDVMELDVERIKAAYKDKGYMDVKVSQPKVTLVNDNEDLDILIEIDEGPQYRVGKVGVKGDLLKPSDELLALVSLKTGEVFDLSEMHKSIERLSDLYADQGYINVNVAPLTSKDTKDLTIDLMFDIDQGKKIFIERVQVRGNTQTRDKVVRRQIPIVEGEHYSSSKVKETKRRVNNLGFFEEVEVSTEPGTTDDQVILNVDVKEQPTGTFTIGAGYSSVDQFIAQGSISQDNFLGLGVKLRVSAALSDTSQTFSLGVTDPYFLDTEWTVGVEGYKTEREYTDYDESRTGGAIKAGHRIADLTKGYLTYRYEQKKITNVTAGSYYDDWVQKYGSDSTHSSITGEVVRNSTDNYRDPRHGGISEIMLQYAGLGGTENFFKTTVEHRQFWPLFWDTVFTVRGKTGYIVATGDDDIPPTEKFKLGGIKTIRGFDTYEVGPQDADGTYIGGETMAFFNFEYLFPISKSAGLKGLLFYDTGNAWLDTSDYFSDMRQSVGAGIRWNSPLGPLRFEWGYNLDPREGEKNSVFEFSIGNAF